ncbi:MAG: UDP-N-acetylmuramoyl-tripeptide--D-alanyl-D-alanine ligase [Bacteroidales bacterium]|jgi:UDP-N-acetylmuramoyl-tripeptide--D-alanyl-D-alanine ligase|nr:UDP-N-acetylmuramoyl-tripeptide--D-alanyl-D-alanine ligase [Bacteroidales bacterium]
MFTILENIYQIFLEHPLVSTDTRHIQPGSLFFALRGDSFNGNEFAAQALQLGASYAIADEPEVAVDARILLVDNVLTTLQDLARLHRMKSGIPVIAITGTNGKTTTKELIYAVLSKKYRTLATQGNLNNHIGVPLTLLQLCPDTEIAIIEMGANHRGEIDFLCHLALPDYGIITNIGRAHLEGFGGFSGVISAKTELYRYLLGNRKKVFVHGDDSLLMEQSLGLERIIYGTGPDGLSVKNINARPFITMDLVFQDHHPVEIQSQLYGKYNVPNMLATACIGQYFGVNPKMIKEALENYRPANNRSQVARTSRNRLILDAYNANPTSMTAALATFAESTWSDKVVLLGDMLELGEESDEEHIRILELLDKYAFQQVFLVGPVFTRLNTQLENICFHDSELARVWLEHHRLTNSTILIKGSRGIKLEKVVDAL